MDVNKGELQYKHNVNTKMRQVGNEEKNIHIIMRVSGFFLF
jgi:hypothetical protein